MAQEFVALAVYRDLTPAQRARFDAAGHGIAHGERPATEKALARLLGPVVKRAEFDQMGQAARMRYALDGGVIKD